jgi:hypothetical protein
LKAGRPGSYKAWRHSNMPAFQPPGFLAFQLIYY